MCMLIVLEYINTFLFIVNHINKQSVIVVPEVIFNNEITIP